MSKEFPKLNGKLILAPMHDITNVAFRLMCKKYGASLVSTELLSANALARENNAVMQLAKTCEEERPVVCQIFSSNTENMVKAAKLMEKTFDVIDINFGCPSSNIVKQGSGGYLLKRKNKIGEIIKEVSKAIEKSLSVKIRLGFDKNEGVEIAKICEEKGANIIAVHARTVMQGYSGNADWNSIKEIKKNIGIPVIGNGDIKNGEDAEKMLKQTNCDYVMVGRAAIGNPFIFQEINHYLKTGEKIKQTKQEKIQDYFEYIELAKKYDIFSVKDAKQKAIEFTKGLEGSSRLRQKLNRVRIWEEIEREMRNL